MKEIEIKIKELEVTIQDSTKQLEILKEALEILTPSEYPKSFESKEDLKKWLDENGIEHQGVYIFKNGYWTYRDKQFFFHLISNGVELTKGLKAKWVYSYGNGGWKYKDEQGKWYEFDKNNNKIR